MPVFILKLLANKYVLYGIMAVAASGMVGLAIEHERHIGAETAVQKELVATQAESARRQKVISGAQRTAEVASQALEQKDRNNASLQKRIAVLSAANDGRSCLDVSSVRRLAEIGQSASGGVTKRSASARPTSAVRLSRKPGR